MLPSLEPTLSSVRTLEASPCEFLALGILPSPCSPLTPAFVVRYLSFFDRSTLAWTKVSTALPDGVGAWSNILCSDAGRNLYLMPSDPSNPNLLAVYMGTDALTFTTQTYSLTSPAIKDKITVPVWSNIFPGSVAFDRSKKIIYLKVRRPFVNEGCPASRLM